LSAAGLPAKSTRRRFPWPLSCLPDEKQRLLLIKIDVEGAEGPIMHNLFEMIHDCPEAMEIIYEMSVSETVADAPDIDMLVERIAAAGFRAFAIPKAYDISAYLSFKRPHARRRSRRP
jgi:hypothetical protein